MNSAHKRQNERQPGHLSHFDHDTAASQTRPCVR